MKASILRLCTRFPTRTGKTVSIEGASEAFAGARWAHAVVTIIVDTRSPPRDSMLSTLAYSPCEPYGKRVKWRSLSH